MNKNNRSRQPRGIPVGGQFAVAVRTEAGLLRDGSYEPQDPNTDITEDGYEVSLRDGSMDPFGRTDGVDWRVLGPEKTSETRDFSVGHASTFAEAQDQMESALTELRETTARIERDTNNPLRPPYDDAKRAFEEGQGLAEAGIATALRGDGIDDIPLALLQRNQAASRLALTESGRLWLTATDNDSEERLGRLWAPAIARGEAVERNLSKWEQGFGIGEDARRMTDAELAAELSVGTWIATADPLLEGPGAFGQEDYYVRQITEADLSDGNFSWRSVSSIGFAIGNDGYGIESEVHTVFKDRHGNLILRNDNIPAATRVIRVMPDYDPENGRPTRWPGPSRVDAAPDMVGFSKSDADERWPGQFPSYVRQEVGQTGDQVTTLVTPGDDVSYEAGGWTVDTTVIGSGASGASSHVETFEEAQRLAGAQHEEWVSGRAQAEEWESFVDED